MCTKLNLHGARWQQIYHYTCQTYASSHHHIYQSFYLFFYLLFFLNNIHCPKTKSILQRNQNQNQINKKINFFVLSRKKKKTWQAPKKKLIPPLHRPTMASLMQTRFLSMERCWGPTRVPPGSTRLITPLQNSLR